MREFFLKSQIKKKKTFKVIFMYFKRVFRLVWQLFSRIVAPLAPAPELQGGGYRRPPPLYPRLYNMSPYVFFLVFLHPSISSFYCTVYIDGVPRVSGSGSESATTGSGLSFQWGMGISAGFFTETTGSLRNPETRRTPSYYEEKKTFIFF